MPVAPPRPKMPPLNALRAFEAAARLGGFTAAAQELCVSPGAVSQHINTVEDWAGIQLFDRKARGVRLTPAGARALPGFVAAFDALGDATRLLTLENPRPPLHIAALPAVAQLLVSPVLPAVRAASPDRIISLTALEQRPNLSRSLFDISVFIDRPRNEPLEMRLSGDRIFPVCTPEIAERLKTPEDLLQETWLYDLAWQDDWALWLKACTPGLAQLTGPGFSLYSLALEEARGGAGVLMGHEALVRNALAEGALVRPFDMAAFSGRLLLLESPGTDPETVNLFREKLDSSAPG